MDTDTSTVITTTTTATAYDASNNCLGSGSQDFPETDVSVVDGLGAVFLASMSNPNDRVFLLRIDKDMENVINGMGPSKIEYADLTSYHRRLVHHVAVSFQVSHLYDAQRRVLTIQKTNESRIPPLRFSEFINTEETKEEVSPSFKIMKRTPTSNQNARSSSPLDEKRGSPSPDIVEEKKSVTKTLEERQEDYNRARQRIFSESTPPTPPSSQPPSLGKASPPPQKETSSTFASQSSSQSQPLQPKPLQPAKQHYSSSSYQAQQQSTASAYRSNPSPHSRYSHSTTNFPSTAPPATTAAAAAAAPQPFVPGVGMGMGMGMGMGVGMGMEMPGYVPMMPPPLSTYGYPAGAEYYPVYPMYGPGPDMQYSLPPNVTVSPTVASVAGGMYYPAPAPAPAPAPGSPFQQQPAYQKYPSYNNRPKTLDPNAFRPPNTVPPSSRPTTTTPATTTNNGPIATPHILEIIDYNGDASELVNSNVLDDLRNQGCTIKQMPVRNKTSVIAIFKTPVKAQEVLKTFQCPNFKLKQWSAHIAVAAPPPGAGIPIS